MDGYVQESLCCALGRLIRLGLLFQDDIPLSDRSVWAEAIHLDVLGAEIFGVWLEKWLDIGS